MIVSLFSTTFRSYRIASLLLLLPSFLATAQLQIDTRDVTTGLRTPVQIVWGGDNHLWVAEREGRISRVHPETGETFVIGQVDDLFSPEERGLFGIALHPNFVDSSHVFLYYSYVRTYNDGNWALLGKVVRYTYEQDIDSLIAPMVIVDSLHTVANNLGGAFIALPDRTLMIGIGDGINFAEEAQSHESTRGKILRVSFDGSVPADNPWSTYNHPQNLIWATGVRNPIGITRIAERGNVYSTDWGTTSLDEINLIEPKGNYGWPHVVGQCDGHPFASEKEFCRDSNVVNPVYEWFKVEGMDALPAGIIYYEGSAIEHWDGSFLVTTLHDGLHQLPFDEDQMEGGRLHRYLSPRSDSSFGRLRGLCLSPDGRIFAATTNAEPNQPERVDKIFEVLDAEEVRDTVVQTPLEVRDVATGLHVPWEIQWGFDNYIWMTERKGVVSRVNPETGEVKTILSIPDIAQRGNTGLLGMALHPNFCDSSEVYLVYTYPVPDDTARMWERLVRYQYDEARDTLVNPLVYVDSIDVTTSHAGSRVVVAPDRTLFMTVSDGDLTALTQDSTSIVGKIIRLNLDGSIPLDNPWADQAWPTSLIWSIGHRNQQGLVLAPNGKLYSSEHGPSSDDEVNLISMGENYGWPDVWGYCDTPSEEKYCREHDIVEPLMAWTPTIATAGLDYYSYDVIPEWKGSLLLAALKQKRLVQMKLNDDGDEIVALHEYFAFEFGRLRDICVAPDGRVFVVTSNQDGLATPAPQDDRIVEIRSQLEHPALPVPGALCDRLLDSVDEEPVLGSLNFIYPHPVVDLAQIKLDRFFAIGTLSVFDVAGRLVRQETFTGGRNVFFKKGELIPGFYMLEIADKDQSIRVRLLIQ